jgi:serine/threonine-protein kinase
MGQVEGSRRKFVQARNPRWRAGNDEDLRVDLQERLGIYSMVMFWSFVADLVMLSVMYYRWPDIEPRNAEAIRNAGACGLVVLALIWRGVLARRPLSTTMLYRIDLFYSVAIGLFVGSGAYFAPELHAAAYAAVVLGYVVVFTRAMIVPSSWRRTAVTTAIFFTPSIAASVGVSKIQEIPPEAVIGGEATFAVVGVLVSAYGSAIIYGLRRQVSQAMQLGSYMLGGMIGQGGMGAVYHARHVLLRRPTAVKLLRPERVGAEMIDRFEREVQLMSQLTHPNTVAIFDYGRNPDGVFYYAMEYLGGIDLHQLVRVHGPQPPERVAHILVQVCGALQEAHDAGLVHRDIKPANIILCERGGVPDVAKVVDFGLVKEIKADSGLSTQVIMGTPHYIAPETLTDPDLVGPASDLYSLGAVGYYLLTGRMLFEGKTNVDICIQHSTKAPVPPSQYASVPAALEAALLRCLEKRPTDRWPSAAALADALAAIPDLAWDREAAAAWWQKFRLPVAPFDAGSPTTTTITVDLGHRG